MTPKLQQFDERDTGGLRRYEYDDEIVYAVDVLLEFRCHPNPWLVLSLYKSVSDDRTTWWGQLSNARVVVQAQDGDAIGPNFPAIDP